MQNYSTNYEFMDSLLDEPLFDDFLPDSILTPHNNVDSHLESTHTLPSKPNTTCYEFTCGTFFVIQFFVTIGMSIGLTLTTNLTSDMEYTLNTVLWVIGLASILALLFSSAWVYSLLHTSFRLHKITLLLSFCTHIVAAGVFALIDFYSISVISLILAVSPVYKYIRLKRHVRYSEQYVTSVTRWIVSLSVFLLALAVASLVCIYSLCWIYLLIIIEDLYSPFVFVLSSVAGVVSIYWTAATLANLLLAMISHASRQRWTTPTIPSSSTVSAAYFSSTNPYASSLSPLPSFSPSSSPSTLPKRSRISMKAAVMSVFCRHKFGCIAGWSWLTVLVDTIAEVHTLVSINRSQHVFYHRNAMRNTTPLHDLEAATLTRSPFSTSRSPLPISSSISSSRLDEDGLTDKLYKQFNSLAYSYNTIINNANYKYASRASVLLLRNRNLYYFFSDLVIPTLITSTIAFIAMFSTLLSMPVFTEITNETRFTLPYWTVPILSYGVGRMVVYTIMITITASCESSVLLAAVCGDKMNAMQPEMYGNLLMMFHKYNSDEDNSKTYDDNLLVENLEDQIQPVI